MEKTGQNALDRGSGLPEGPACVLGICLWRGLDLVTICFELAVLLNRFKLWWVLPNKRLKLTARVD